MTREEKLTPQEKKKIIAMFRSGAYLVQEICWHFKITSKVLKKIVTDAGFGY